MQQKIILFLFSFGGLLFHRNVKLH